VPLAAMQTSIVGKRSVNAQQLTGIDAIKSVAIDCVNATIRHNSKWTFNTPLKYIRDSSTIFGKTIIMGDRRY